MFEVRAERLAIWLTFLKKHNQYYGDVDVDCHAIHGNFADILMREAHVCDKETTINLQKTATSDIASTRPQPDVAVQQTHLDHTVRIEHVMVTSRNLPTVEDDVLCTLHDLCVALKDHHANESDDSSESADEDTLEQIKAQSHVSMAQNAPHKTTTISRSSVPVNEFTEGARFFSCASLICSYWVRGHSQKTEHLVTKTQTI